MNLVKTKIISVIVIFALSFLVHFGYDILENPVTAIFFPVNESIWEHIKMLFTSIVLNGLIEYFIIRKFNVKSNNFLFSLFISALVSIPIFLIIYLPFYYKVGPKMVINIGVLLVTIIICEVIAYYIQKRNDIKINDIIPAMLIIVCYTIFGLLTYYPIKNDIFFDTMDEKYGINTYYLSD